MSEPTNFPPPHKRPYQNIVIVGDLTLDPRSGKVTIPNQTAWLTITETAVLKFLMQHPDVPFRDLEIIRQVWGEEYRGSYQTVRQHIRAIRLKIEPTPSEPQYLVTIQYFGYMVPSPQSKVRSQIVEANDVLGG